MKQITKIKSELEKEVRELETNLNEFQTKSEEIETNITRLKEEIEATELDKRNADIIKVGYKEMSGIRKKFDALVYKKESSEKELADLDEMMKPIYQELNKKRIEVASAGRSFLQELYMKLIKEFQRENGDKLLYLWALGTKAGEVYPNTFAIRLIDGLIKPQWEEYETKMKSIMAELEAEYAGG